VSVSDELSLGVDDTDSDAGAGDALTSRPIARTVGGPKGKKKEPAPPSPETTALVKQWLRRVSQGKHKAKEAFKKMRENEYLAIHGAPKAWKQGGNYTVAILNRHINQAVAQLYARDPVADAKPRKKMRYAVWDGRSDTLQAALQGSLTGDPNAHAIVNDVLQARAQEEQVKKTGQTLEILWSYFTTQQANGFRQQMKALVRRTKVSSVGYVKLTFQRALEPRPAIGAKIEDATSMLAALERLQSEKKEGEIEDESADAAELKSLIEQLKDQEYIVVREGPVFDFPRATQIIVDPDCTHLKTFTGARWVAHQFDLDKDEIREIYGVELPDDGRSVNQEGETTEQKDAELAAYDVSEGAKKKARNTHKVYEIQDKKNSQFLTVCEGHDDFLKPPEEPDVQLDRFFTIFPLVFNEIESEEEIYPPSDVELLTDTQMEYNRVRQGLREHRKANRPKYAVAAGVLTDEDIGKLAAHPAHAVLELKALQPGQDVSKLIQRLQMIGIDPNQYNAQDLFSDIERVVGTQQANLGTGSNTTATETSIVEQGRQAGLSDCLDDLDELLSLLALAAGEVMLKEMSVEMVKKIVGQGAVWPDAPPSRQELSENLYLDVKAGSSGRPNRAVELANLERVLPILLQIPGVNPAPIRDRIMMLSDIDPEETTAENMPSITALNAMMAKSGGPPGAGPGLSPQGAASPNPPQNQGPAGPINITQTNNAPGPQPGMPAQTLPAAIG
jgi:hypothetical protein